MKKCKVILMVLVLVFGLFGCGKNNTNACEQVVKNFGQAVNAVDLDLLEKTYIPWKRILSTHKV